MEMMFVMFNLSQRRLLARFCSDVAKGMALAYLVGSAIFGKPTAVGIASTIHAFLTIALLLAIALLLLQEDKE
jgi:hypothetical protein